MAREWWNFTQDKSKSPHKVFSPEIFHYNHKRPLSCSHNFPCPSRLPPSASGSSSSLPPLRRRVASGDHACAAPTRHTSHINTANRPTTNHARADHHCGGTHCPRPAANGQQRRGAKFLHFRQTTFKNKIGRRIKKDALRTKDKRDPFFRVSIFRVFRASLHQASHRGRQAAIAPWRS